MQTVFLSVSHFHADSDATWHLPSQQLAWKMLLKVSNRRKVGWKEEKRREGWDDNEKEQTVFLFLCVIKMGSVSLNRHFSPCQNVCSCRTIAGTQTRVVAPNITRSPWQGQSVLEQMSYGTAPCNLLCPPLSILYSTHRPTSCFITCLFNTLCQNMNSSLVLLSEE